MWLASNVGKKGPGIIRGSGRFSQRWTGLMLLSRLVHWYAVKGLPQGGKTRAEQSLQRYIQHGLKARKGGKALYGSACEQEYRRVARNHPAPGEREDTGTRGKVRY